MNVPFSYESFQIVTDNFNQYYNCTIDFSKFELCEQKPPGARYNLIVDWEKATKTKVYEVISFDITTGMFYLESNDGDEFGKFWAYYTCNKDNRQNLELKFKFLYWGTN